MPNYLVQRTMASEVKNFDAQYSSLGFQLTYYNDEGSLLSGSVNLAITRAGLRLWICLRNMATGDILPNSESLKSHAEEELNGALFIQSLQVLLMCHDNCALIRQVFNPEEYSTKLVGCIGEDGKENNT